MYDMKRSLSLRHRVQLSSAVFRCIYNFDDECNRCFFSLLHSVHTFTYFCTVAIALTLQSAHGPL